MVVWLRTSSGKLIRNSFYRCSYCYKRTGPYVAHEHLVYEGRGEMFSAPIVMVMVWQ